MPLLLMVFNQDKLTFQNVFLFPFFFLISTSAAAVSFNNFLNSVKGFYIVYTLFFQKAVLSREICFREFVLRK